jgi:hypothetical protein
VRVVRLRPAELVVRDPGAERAVHEVLQLSAPAVVADDDVELAVGPEPDHAPVVIAPQRLARIGLERAEPDDVRVEGERRAVPREPVDAVSEQRHVGEVAAVRARAALGPVEEQLAVDEELRRERDAEQPPLGRAVDGQVEDRRLHGAVHDPQHLAGVLLEDEHVVRSEERDADRRRQPRDGRANGEVGVDDGWRRLRERRGHQRRCGYGCESSSHGYLRWSVCG